MIRDEAVRIALQLFHLTGFGVKNCLSTKQQKGYERADAEKEMDDNNNNKWLICGVNIQIRGFGLYH